MNVNFNINQINKSGFFDNYQKKRILIVDDEPFNVLGMQMNLNNLEIKGLSQIIDRAYNGQEALSKVKNSFEQR
jgi:CheY-like chemotaxis protein